MNSDDPQVVEALKDIESSGKQIGQLETLDKKDYEDGMIDNLIGFHQLRISNCQVALKKLGVPLN